MHKFFSMAAVALVSTLLAACGGSAFSGSSSAATGTPASIAVSSSTASIPSDGSSGATVSAVVKDASSAPVAGVTVAFTTSAGTVTTTQGTTDSTGTAKATLVAGSATPGATITVTATSGTLSGKATVTVANTQKTMTLLTSVPSIPSDGSTTATISALVRDANNNFVSGAAVAFAATSGGLTVTQGTTDSSGTAKATLSSAGDTSNRTITVTATTGNTKATITVSVVGTKLTVSGPANLIQGAAGTFTVSLTDAGGNGIANDNVTLSSAAGNTITPASYTTDATGQKTFTVTATNSGTDTITVSAAGLKATATVTVSNQNFAFTSPAVNTKVNLGVSQALTIHWASSGAPVAGATVQFSATRGTLSAASAVTDASGNATVSISSAQSGPTVITASGTGVSAQTSLDFLATTPVTLTAQASPATIGTRSTSTITVTVRDGTNNLVEGKTVNFAITQDVTGGTLSVSSAVTDTQGQASTVYTSSSTTSAKDGVTISGTVQGTSVTGNTKLTVSGQTVFLSLGTGNTISNYPTGTANDVQYELPYSVQAVDNAGHGVGSVSLAYTVTSLAYLKGQLTFVGSAWQVAPPSTSQVVPPGAGFEPDYYLLTGLYGCKSEDVSNNGIYVAANDYNTNGKLDPGQVVSLVLTTGSTTTASDGSAHVNLIYPKDHAYWTGVRLTVTATVAGTQSSTSADFWLPGLADDYNSQAKAPPGFNSPYGQASTCQNPN